ncbi:MULTISPECIES: siderophore-interacting protein [unclassified Streptomyces]|uniref:siderophore-interacting protein n=1 Tax=unclassified Streptomyces TaxID=2593676 RepID=UPI00278C4E51|nr:MULTISPECIES: siderophore-interacting protein [unclassified Streptomyces]
MTPASRSTPPFDLFDLHVLRASRLTPSMIRVVFGGADLSRMESAGRDQRIKLFLPAPGQQAPQVPDNSDGNWYPAWQALNPATRGIMRTYTIRDLRTAPTAELTVDFAVHGDSGPASRWALRARPGDRVSVLGPVVEENAAYDFRPPPDTDWVLLTADGSALPAVAAILEHLPHSLPVHAWIEGAPQPLTPNRPHTTITWLPPTTSPVEALRESTLPEGLPYAWVAGESSTVKAIRRHLVTARSMDRNRVKFSGYWRKGTSEDTLMTNAEAA